MSLRSPRPLLPTDDASAFDCGAASLNDWLRSRALKNETTGASRTFVSIDGETDAVAGYYCLSASSLLMDDAPGNVRRNMPDPVPVILIGRLAVDQAHKGMGLGASLLQHALLKGLEASRIVGARAFIVDALDDDAERFYSKFGFKPMPPASKRAMYLLVNDAEATLHSVERDSRTSAVVDGERLRNHFAATVAATPEGVLREGVWVVTIPGLPIAVEASQYEDAISELVLALREYAEDWHGLLDQAPNHADNWGLVQLVERSTEEQLKRWVTGHLE
ncbi:MAG: GNAT family N-acetyltransferase [Rhodoglobus sp.]